VLSERIQGFLPRAYRDRLDPLVADELDESLALACIVLDHEQPLDRTVDERGQPAQHLAERLGGRGLLEKAKGAHAPGSLAAAARRDNLGRDVPQLAIVLDAIEDGPPIGIRESQVERDTGGLEASNER